MGGQWLHQTRQALGPHRHDRRAAKYPAERVFSSGQRLRADRCLWRLTEEQVRDAHEIAGVGVTQFDRAAVLAFEQRDMRRELVP